jgi:hypothetical protein
MVIALWLDKVVSRVKLNRAASNARQRTIASRAAGMADRAGCAKSMRRGD